MSKTGPKTVTLVTLALMVFLSGIGIAYANKAASAGNAVATQGTTYALVVGISDYAPCGPGGPDLSFADEDADSAESALTGVYGLNSANVTKLKDCAATRTAIHNWLSDAANTGGSFTATGADDVVVYLSGHGTIAFDSACADGAGDGDKERIDNAFLVNDTTETEIICDGELAGLVAAIPAARKAVVLDISFPSGFKDDFSKVSNTLFIAAARGEAREASFSGPCSPGRGVFTCLFVVQGILGGQANNAALNPHTYDDGDIAGNEITLEEAYDFVFHAARRVAQKPNIVDNVADDFLPAD